VSTLSTDGGDLLKIVLFKEIKVIMNQGQFVSELSKLRPAATFLSLIGYRNEASEVADYSIIFHMSYANALRRSLVALESIVPSDDLGAIAKQELQVSYQASLDKMATTPVEEIDDNYTRFFDDDGSYVKGIKLHTETNALHIYGLVNHKRVLMPGQYKKTNRRPLTIAKDKLRKLCPVNRFRQFKITPNQVDRISVENLSLLPPFIE
jgi:hypothetical protein